MKRFIYSFITSTVILSSCGQEAIQNDETQKLSTIILQPGVNDYTDAPGDSSENPASAGDFYMLEGIRFENDKLVVTVAYSGGCAAHTFEVQGQVLPMDSAPLQAQIAIVHEGNGDNCEAWISEDISIDLTELLGTDQVDVSIFNPSQTEMRYSFLAYRHLPQGNECVLESTFEEAICGSGMYGNKWFKLKGEDLYLQPVSIKLSVDDTKLELGKSYKVGFWNTHWAGDSTVNCLAYPGPSVVSEISCIEPIN